MSIIKKFHQSIKGIIGNTKLYSIYLYNNILDTIGKLRNLYKTNLDLALYHFHQGHLNDAILRFKLVSYLNKKDNKLKYYLGRCYMEKYKYGKAAYFFTQYQASQDSTFTKETEYCLKIINDKTDSIEDIPLSIVQHHFEQLSSIYNEVFILGQEKINQVDIVLLLEQHSPIKLSSATVLDLGCGTGIIGQLFREANIGSHIVGVDMTNGMVEPAQELQYDDSSVYNSISVQDIATYLDTCKKSFNIVVASNILPFIGNIKLFLQQVEQVCYDDTILIFSFETTELSSKQFIPAQEKFFHSPEYIKSSAKGWKVLSEEDITFFEKYPGKVLMLQKVG